VLVALAGCGMLLNSELSPIGYSLISKGIGFATIFSLVLLLRNGTFLASKYFRILSVGVFILMTGAVLKILHWAGANIAIMIASAGFIIIYTTWFFFKKKKHLLDILKALWVLTFFSGMDFRINHWLYANQLYYIADILLLLILIIFAWTEFNNDRKLPQVLE
jgi:hypothetical protein